MDEPGLRLPTLLVDVVTLGAGGIILLILFTAITPTRRGFYCEDESIRYPFKASTVPNYLLYIYGFIIPLLVIIVTEFVIRRRSSRSVFFLCRPCPLWAFTIYRSLVDFLFGVGAGQLVTDVGKYSIGRLRPNFLDVCRPNITLTDCAIFGHKYIEEYSCLGSNDDAAYSRVSFPSGHSSFSAFTMLYTAIFIQVKWTSQSGQLSRSFRLVKHGTQLVFIILAYFTALSRVMDNKHHWSDVLIGALIGAVAASLTAKYVSKLAPDYPLFHRISLKDVNNGQRQSLNNAGEDEELRRRQTSPKTTIDHVIHKSTHLGINMEERPTSTSSLLMSSPETSIN